MWTAGLAALAAAGLCACSGLPRGPIGPLPVDLTSPVAGEIQRSAKARRNAAYPSFLQVPSQPSDVRPTTAWNRNIFDTLRSRRELQAFEVANPQSLYGADAFAQEQRALAAPPLSEAEVQAQAGQSADFTRSGKTRATPPSPAR